MRPNSVLFILVFSLSSRTLFNTFPSSLRSSVDYENFFSLFTSSIQKMINKRDSCLAVIFIILQLKFFPFEFDDEKRVNLSI